jgi:large subunit ribosomal protein L22
MEARAEARYIRVSPQKARLVVDLIRGQRAGDAINILRSTNKGIAPTVEKVLRSAIANAENKSDSVDVDQLVVNEAYVNEGHRVRLEAYPPRPDGPCVPLPAPDQPYCCGCGGKIRGAKENHGSKNTSLRLPAGRHQNVAFALVR